MQARLLCLKTLKLFDLMPMISKHNTPMSLRDWLGFTSSPNYANAKSLGRVLGSLLLLFVLLLVVSVLVVLADFFQASLRVGPYKNDADGSAIRNIGLVLAALIGAPFIIWRTIVASKQVAVAEESLFNEKISAAQQGLTARHEISHVQNDGEGQQIVVNEWVDDLVTRAAALDTLEGLVAERPEAAPRIVKIVAAYVRGTFPAKNLIFTEPPFDRKTPRLDLQRAVDVIGRVHRTAVKVDTGKWRLDLRKCDFDGVNFQEGYFWASDFSGSRFEASFLDGGVFEGCRFIDTLLNFASFKKTNLVGVRFDVAIINRPEAPPHQFVSSINLGNIRGASFIKADISALHFLGTKETLPTTFGTQDTQVSVTLRMQMPDPGKHSNVVTRRLASSENPLDAAEVAETQEVDATGFQNWAPWASSDMSTSFLFENHLESLGMKKWPYW